MRYLIEPKGPIYVKGYGFLSCAKQVQKPEQKPEQ